MEDASLTAEEHVVFVDDAEYVLRPRLPSDITAPGYRCAERARYNLDQINKIPHVFSTCCISRVEIGKKT